MISVEATERFRKCLRQLGLKREIAFKLMMNVVACWGHPHLHLGSGIRRLRRNLFECRCGRHIRFVFVNETNTLVFDFAGNHDEVRAYLRNRS